MNLSIPNWSLKSRQTFSRLIALKKEVGKKREDHTYPFSFLTDFSEDLSFLIDNVTILILTWLYVIPLVRNILKPRAWS